MICCRCKRDLPEDAFYKYDKSRCKECIRKMRYDKYHKTHTPIYINDKGQWMRRQGKKAVLHWTGNMISELKRYFPTTKNKELAELIGVSERTIVRKARELGLEKDAEWQKNMSRNNGFYAYYGNEKKRVV